MRRRALIIFVILLLLAVGALGAYIAMIQNNQKETVEVLKLSDYPEIFGTDTVIIIGEGASEIEREAAELIAAGLEEIADTRPEIITPKDVQHYKNTYNLIVVGTLDSNSLLVDILERIGEYPCKWKAILIILKNPWNPKKGVLIVAGSDKLEVRKVARLVNANLTGVKKGMIVIPASSSIESGEQNKYKLTLYLESDQWISGVPPGFTIPIEVIQTSDSKQKVIASKWTDENGRVSFLLPPGVYICQVPEEITAKTGIFGSLLVHLSQDTERRFWLWVIPTGG